MKELLELQLNAKEKQLNLIENRIRIAGEIEKKSRGVSWEEMQEFLGHSYENIGQVEDREEQRIDPALFAQINADLVASARKIGKEIDKLKAQLAKLNAAE